MFPNYPEPIRYQFGNLLEVLGYYGWHKCLTTTLGQPISLNFIFLLGKDESIADAPSDTTNEYHSNIWSEPSFHPRSNMHNSRKTKETKN
jgi:hypothetical protein